MGIEYYLFAAFIFALGAVLVWMIVKGVRKGRAEEDVIREQREKKLEAMQDEINSLLVAMETYVEESKAEVVHMVRQTEKTFQEASRSFQAGGKTEKGEDAKEGILASGRNGLRMKVVELKQNGHSVGEIAEKFEISQGEVYLLLNMGS